ncbi:MAG: class I SAM-dependent methyltransferase [bacterium]
MIKRVIKRCLPERAVALLYKFKLRIQNKDDFEWSEYTKEYSKQISEVMKENTLILPDGKYSIVNGKIVLETSLLPLHPNHKLLYETIYDLNPNSLLEVGCGCGDHLANIQKMLPEIEISGCDLLEDHVRFLLSRHPELKITTTTNLFVHDITISSPSIKVDLVYTHAVIMHIQRNNRHLNALRNIFYTSKKYIVLMENWGRHNFYEDIRKISKEPDFPWESIYLYVNDDGKQILMVISNTVLEGYKELHSNKELLK